MTQEQYVNVFMEGVKTAFEIIKGKKYNAEELMSEIGIAYMAKIAEEVADRLVPEEERT